MLNPLDALCLLCSLPILGGGAYSLLTPLTTQRFLARPLPALGFQPSLTVLKPVRGLEKGLKTNLRSIALQDYPDYQVIYSVQDPQDPALPLLQAIQTEFGPQKVTVVVQNIQAGANGKVNNLLGALTQARYDVLVISDSDTCLRPDYLTTIVAPLADPQVGCVCTPFRLTQAERWFEKLELLAINTDFIPSVLFAEVTGASKACLGSSIALHRSTLEGLGGFASLADYLVEDFELGRRVWSNQQQLVLLPYVIDTVIDLANYQDWWRHQVYWDQNTYLARPWGFMATIILKALPFALLLVALGQGDALSLSVLALTLALRAVSVLSVAWQLQDWESIRALPWLPLRDFGDYFLGSGL